MGKYETGIGALDEDFDDLLLGPFTLDPPASL